MQRIIALLKKHMPDKTAAYSLARIVLDEKMCVEYFLVSRISSPRLKRIVKKNAYDVNNYKILLNSMHRRFIFKERKV